MSVSIDQLRPLLPVLAVILTALVVGIAIARVDNLNHRARRRPPGNDAAAGNQRQVIPPPQSGF
jgi:hypothetical protein